MRIVPVTSRYTNLYNSKSFQTQFERKENVANFDTHKYTGNASYDLAYASMYDNDIAKELKLMGLI